ncbi:hypothetical protein D3C80_684300 [compost metagenome]
MRTCISYGSSHCQQERATPGCVKKVNPAAPPFSLRYRSQKATCFVCELLSFGRRVCHERFQRCGELATGSGLAGAGVAGAVFGVGTGRNGSDPGGSRGHLARPAGIDHRRQPPVRHAALGSHRWLQRRCRDRGHQDASSAEGHPPVDHRVHPGLRQRPPVRTPG